MKQVLIYSKALLSTLCLLLTQGAVGQSIDLATPLPVDTSFRAGQLSNGLRYFIQPHDEPKDRAEFRLVVKVGSLQEEDDQLGVAHFVEHMAFNGTVHFQKNELIDFLELAGGRFGADLNASTSFSETIYKLQVPTDSAELIDQALLILQDWAYGLTFDSLEVEKERGIVRSEWRSRLSANQRLQQQHWPVLLQNSRYANRLPIGDPLLIDTVPKQRLVDFYEKWYQPDQMALIVVGQVDPAAIELAVRDRFGQFPERALSVAPDVYELDPSPRTSYVLASDPEFPFTAWKIVYQLDKPADVTTYGTLRQSLIAQLHDRMLNARLFELREKGVPTFTFGFSGFSGLPGNHDSYEINAFTSIDQLEASLATLLSETKRVHEHGFTDEELNQHKANISRNIRLGAEEYDKIPSSSRANMFIGAFLKGTEVLHIPSLPEIYDTLLAGISLEEVHLLARTWPDATVRTSLLSVKESVVDQVPDSSQWYQLIDSLWSLPTRPYVVAGTADELLVLDQEVGTSTLLEIDTVLDIHSYELSNGMRIHLKPTDFKNDEILMRAVSIGGNSRYDGEDLIAAKHAVNILNESGLDTLSSTQLDRLLAGKEARIGPSISAYNESISGRTNQHDLADLMQLMYLHFTAPRFDSIILENYRQKQSDIFRRLDEDPRSAWARMLLDYKYDYHPHRPHTDHREFDSLTLDRIAAVYADRFANAADFDLVAVGNFSIDSLLRLAEQYLAILPGSADREEWHDSGLRLLEQNLDTTVVAGQTQKAEVNLEWHGPFLHNTTDERYHFVSLRSLFNTRLRESLREDLGGVYGVRLSGSFRYRPDTLYYFKLRFNCDPSQVDTLIATIKQQIDHIAAGEIEANELEKIQQSQLQYYDEALRSNRFWLGQIVNRIEQKRSFDGLYPGRYEALVKSLSAERLAELAQQYLQEAFYFRFVLLPEESVEP